MDYDYALAEIRRNMHDPRGPKAAVMVGAGFSLNAIAIRGAKRRSFPDWAALTTVLVERLYSEPSDRKKILQSVGATSSALRLAQEFESAHGRPALIDVIRESIPEDDFIPSPIHEQLMNLNWADVFTTNYDRLLERATLQRLNQRQLRAQRYDLVLDSSDLPLARRPRIVKLHGSLPDLANLVLTEDDYRRYPIDRAAFVNAVRASLTENVFCLIGFSGDDPNFLAWTGWIRDVLNKSSPPIYLFRGSPLKPFQRRLLEQRNIIPIPICELSGRKGFSEAFAWLFDVLAKPLDEPTAKWNLGPNFVDTFQSSDGTWIDEPFDAKPSKKDPAIDAAIMWRRHRLQYKGWHVLYRLGITRLSTYTEFWSREVNLKALKDFTPYECLFVLREYLWRNSLALQPVDDFLVEKVIDPLLATYAEWRQVFSGDGVSITSRNDHKISITLTQGELSDAYQAILLELLRHAREIGDHERFSSIANRLSEQFNSSTSVDTRNAQHFVTYQKVLQMLSRIEHDLARESLHNWDTSDADDIWTIRRAGLMLECGLRDFAVSLLIRVLNRLASIRRGTEIDYALRSAEGLALHLLWYCSRSEAIGAPKKVRRTSTEAKPGADSRFDIGSSDDGYRDVKTNVAVGLQPALTEYYESVMPEETAIRRRLKELGELGCDPYELLDWLRLLHENKQLPRQGVEEQESFDPGNVSRTYRSGNAESVRNAHRAIRFIEDAGLPLMIHQVAKINVCQTLYRNAAQTIAILSPREGIGLVMRSRDAKLIDACFSRDLTATLSLSQIRFLKSVGQSAMQRAVERLGPAPNIRDDEDEWWEGQLLSAVKLLGRVVVRVSEKEADELATEAIKLASNVNLWNRLSLATDVSVFVRRSMEALSRPSSIRLLPELMQVDVPGSARFPIQSDSSERWFDPLSAIPARAESASYASLKIADLVPKLFDEIRVATSRYRENLVLRAVSLLSLRYFAREDQAEFADALFARTDESGFPANTGCYDALILALPRVASVNEKELFQKKYVRVDSNGDEYWDNLKRTVNRFGPPLNTTKRSVKWSQSDLEVILKACDAWIPTFERRIAEERDESRYRSALMDAFREPRRVALKGACRNWLEVVEDVVLLAPNVKKGQISQAAELIKRVKEIGADVLKVSPTLVCLGQLDSAEESRSMERSLIDSDEVAVQQACSGISRWAELTRADYHPAIPKKLLATLGTLIALPRYDQLPLLLETAREVIEILGHSIPRPFLTQVLTALEVLSIAANYKPLSQDMSIGRMFHIRILCVRIAVVLHATGVSKAPVRKWIDLAKDDVFSDVRQSLLKYGEAANA